MSYAYSDETTTGTDTTSPVVNVQRIEGSFDFLFGVLRRFMPDGWMPFLEHFGSQLKGRRIVRITIEAVE